MSEPVTAEELAAAGPCAVSLTSIAPYHAKAASFGGASFEFHARAQTTVERAAELLPRLARDLTAERATSARLADKVLDLGRELEALRDAVVPPTWIAGRFCRLGAFGLGIGPEGTGSAGRAFLFFWAAGPASTCHWFASYRSIEHAREQAPEDARAIIGPASGCECTFAGPCTEHASERADDFLQVRS